MTCFKMLLLQKLEKL